MSSNLSLKRLTIAPEALFNWSITLPGRKVAFFARSVRIDVEFRKGNGATAA
jgi:hypothetical protein